MAIIKPTSVDSGYLKGYLHTEVFKSCVDDKTTGSTRKSLGVQSLRELPVFFPEDDEQTKVGNLFKQLDTLLNQHQTQLKKLNNIKQACLEKMFV